VMDKNTVAVQHQKWKRKIETERLCSMAVILWVGFMQVTELRNNASLNQGKQVQNGWTMFTKANDNIAQVNGNFNIVPSAVNILCDPDFIDLNQPNAGGQSPVVGNNLEAV